MSSKNSVTCRFCEQCLVPLGFTCNDNKNIDVLICKACDLVQLSDFSHINESYYSSYEYVTDYIELNDSKDLISARARESLWNKKRLELIQFNIPDSKKMKVLDYGCGHGGFLEVCQGQFQDIMGYDLSVYYRDELLKNGWNVVNELDCVGIDPDIIVFFHVLEHVEKPWELVSQMIEKFNSLKYLIIEVPNTSEILNSIFKNKAYGLIHYSSDHLYYFTHETLKMILKKSGLPISICTGLQRYSIANQFGWLAKNKGGGQEYWSFLDDKDLNRNYSDFLIKNNIADSIFIISQVSN